MKKLSKIYSVKIRGNGTPADSVLPVGWTVSQLKRNTARRFIVTHNLNLSNENMFMIAQVTRLSEVFYLNGPFSACATYFDVNTIHVYLSEMTAEDVDVDLTVWTLRDG
jgi:hypothetical protein